MSAGNGQAQPAPPAGLEELPVDPGVVINSLAAQVARLTVDLAVRDAALAGIRAELEELRQALEAAATKPAAEPAAN